MLLDKVVGADFRQFTSIARVLSQRHVTTRYRGSALGLLWSVLSPVIMTTLYALVFGRAFSHFYDGSIVKYAAAVFVGLVVIQFFSTSTTQALQSIVSSGALLGRMRVPSLVLPVSVVLANVVQLVCATTPVLAILALVIGRNALAMPVIILPLIGLLGLSFGVGAIMAAAFVYFRDVPYIYDMFVFFVFIATPIFYPLEIVPLAVRQIIEWNPITMVVEELRTIVVLGVFPSPTSVVIMLLLGALSITIGTTIFRFASRSFMNYL